jgi:hypothetical protein
VNGLLVGTDWAIAAVGTATRNHIQTTANIRRNMVGLP